MRHVREHEWRHARELREDKERKERKERWARREAERGDH
jgi:hypothetical protein